jgi:hypothetical protein
MRSENVCAAWKFRRRSAVRSIRQFVIALVLVDAAAAKEPSYTCATCHVKEAASQPATPMGGALKTAGHNPLFKENKDLRFAGGRFVYDISTRGDQTTYTVSDGATSIALPLQWTVGNGAQTFVLERDGQFFESLVSYYPEIGALDITLGDERLQPQVLNDAIGRKLELREVTDCFNCHSTRSSPNHKLDLTSMIPGLTCARCHQDTGAHLASVSAMKTKSAGKMVKPEALGKKSAESMSTFCGQCHRSWQTVVRNDWTGQSNVRFQPYRLENSRCFDGADARISCIACHNPHEDVVKDGSSYDNKCLACHAAANQSTGKACPVANANCVTCHMPRIRLPGGHQTFTDHDIRVVHTGEAYPN